MLLLEEEVCLNHMYWLLVRVLFEEVNAADAGVVVPLLDIANTAAPEVLETVMVWLIPVI